MEKSNEKEQSQIKLLVGKIKVLAEKRVKIPGYKEVSMKLIAGVVIGLLVLISIVNRLTAPSVNAPELVVANVQDETAKSTADKKIEVSDDIKNEVKAETRKESPAPTPAKSALAVVAPKASGDTAADLEKKVLADAPKEVLNAALDLSSSALNPNGDIADLVYPEYPIYYPRRQAKPIASALVEKLHRNDKERNRPQYRVIIKDGYAIVKVGYYDEPTPIIEEIEVLDMAKGIRTVTTYHRKNGSLKSEERYKTPKGSKGGRDGVFKEYHDNGFLFQEETFVDGVRQGVKKVYTSKGTLSEELHLKDDLKHGLCKEFYDNGQVRKEEPYEMGYLEGVRKDYRVDGTLQETKSFKKSKPDGETVRYDRDGKTIIKRQMFKDGAPVN